MKKIFLLIVSISLISACGNTPKSDLGSEENPNKLQEIEVTPEPSIEISEILPQAHSNADRMTIVSTTDYSMLSPDSMETITLYTSAKKDNGRFHWDDHARWLLEISSENGSYYTLYDSEISNGSLYFDLLSVDKHLYVLVKNISTASNYTKIYTIDQGRVLQTNDLNLNDMHSETINMIFTSIPQYR